MIMILFLKIIDSTFKNVFNICSVFVKYCTIMAHVWIKVLSKEILTTTCSIIKMIKQ